MSLERTVGVCADWRVSCQPDGPKGRKGDVLLIWICYGSLAEAIATWRALSTTQLCFSAPDSGWEPVEEGEEGIKSYEKDLITYLADGLSDAVYLAPVKTEVRSAEEPSTEESK